MQKNVDFKRYFQFFILIIGAGAIYPLVYLRTSFQTPMLEAFGLDVSQLSNLYAMLGTMFIVGYFPSGWLADKISAKKLISFSLLVTGILGFWFSTYPSFQMMYIIFFAWGISTVFTFWSALIKAVKMLAKQEEQARFFGVLDGGRGVVEALLGTVAMLIFSYFMSGENGGVEATKSALSKVIYMYSVACIVLSALVGFFLSESQESEKTKEDSKVSKNKLNLIDSLKRVASTPEVWIMSSIIFCGYVLYWTIYYFSGYLTTNHSVPSITAGYVSVVILWMRPIGGIGGGFLGDKIGKEKVLAMSMLLASIGLGVLAIFPEASQSFLPYVMVVFVGLMLYFIRGLYWSLLDECKIPDYILGLAIGFISFMGYLPDIIIPIFSGNVFTKYQDGAQAYNTYFIVSAIIGLIGTAITLYFGIRVRKKNADKKEVIA